MGTVVIVCTDGSDLAVAAANEGLAILKPADRVIVVTAVDGIDPSLTSDGSGHSGPSMSPEAYDAMRTEALAAAEAVLASTVASLEVDDVETRILEGSPGESLCALAAELDTRALVMGTRGLGRIKRALMGSVSDYVIRNAPCPVLVIGEKD